MQDADLKPFALSTPHTAAATRRRRIVVNHQVDGLLKAVNADMSIAEIMEYEFAFADEPGTHIDAQWWSWDNVFPLDHHKMINENAPSVPGYLSAEKVRTFERWAENGINIAEIYIGETRQRGLECFYSFRMNEDIGKNDEGDRTPEDWIIPGEWDQPLMNLAVPEVRAHKVGYFRELVERYDFDGVEVDFARGTINTPVGHQWEMRDVVTRFLHEVRAATLEVERQRGRPVLVAVRVPDCLLGCTFDGLDVAAWISLNLADIIVLGVRSHELEIEQFTQLIGNRPVQVHACLDDHHCSDGYSWPPIEVWRGSVCNWWSQGADAIQTFNWGVAPPAMAERFGLRFRGAYEEGGRQIPVYQQAYHELGDPEALRFRDKHFIVQRRGGGGSGGMDIDQWATPRHNYQNTNMLGQLPAPLDPGGRVDTLVRLRVEQDLHGDAGHLSSLTLRLLLSASPPDRRKPEPGPGQLEAVSINPFWDGDQLFTRPLATGAAARLQVRVNNYLLTAPRVEGGWIVYELPPAALARGGNLIGVALEESSANGPATLEKLEVHALFRDPSAKV